MSLSNSEESISIIRSICNCSEERALELFEAGGSIERAIDIHLHHHNVQGSESVATTTIENKTNNIVDEIHPPLSKRMKTTSTTKQVLDPFFEERSEKQGKRGKNLQQETCFNSKGDGSAVRKFYSEGGGELRSKTECDDRLHYLRLAEVFEKMADTTKRLIKLDLLKQLFRSIIETVGGIGGDEKSRFEDSKVLEYAIDLTVGSSLKLQVSGSAVSKAVMSVTGALSTQLRSVYRETGDLGDVAARFSRNQRLLVQPKPLSIVAVYQTLETIASQEGKGSQKSRHTHIVKLLRSCRSYEIRFLVRTLLGNMRLGANMRTVLAALAMAVTDNIDNNNKIRDDAIKAMQDTFDFCPRLDKTCLAVLVGGIPYMVKTCTLEVGYAINPMLANAAHSLIEVEKMMKTGGSAVAEWKYDGVRCQAHFTDQKIKLFSRHMIENTEQFPDAVSFFMKAKKSNISSFIIDSEIVGVEHIEADDDNNNNIRLLPFQDLSTRRGVTMKENETNIQIKIFAFDLMFLNGESLVNRPLAARQKALMENFNTTESFSLAQSITLTSFDESAITKFLQTAVEGGGEGLMIKLQGDANNIKNEATEVPKPPVKSEVITSNKDIPKCYYESGVRSHTWLKVKRDYVAGFADTIDVVPIGAWYGNGRKAQKGFLSPVLLAVYDEEEDVFRSISRCMSFTDAMYSAMHDFYINGVPYPSGVGIDETENVRTGDNELVNIDASVSKEVREIDPDSENDNNPSEAVNCYPTRPTALVVTNECPSIWFKPSEVFEVSFADLTLSKQHSAASGLVDSTRGVALRFPRFKRRRPDKRIDQATTTMQIAELFAKQAKQK